MRRMVKIKTNELAIYIEPDTAGKDQEIQDKRDAAEST
jgi:hypothetical protein